MQTEQEYLKNYRQEDFPRPSLTTDVVAFTIRSREEDSYRHDPKGVLSILLIRRGAHPFLNRWALPGGFLRPGETVEDCALREITEEANVVPASLLPVGVYSEPGRDPRGWIISNAYASVISEDSIQERGGDDARDAKWFEVRLLPGEKGLCTLELSRENSTLRALLLEEGSRFGRPRYRIQDPGDLAFDHARIIVDALTVLRAEARNFEGIFDFLPEKFTLTSLQRVQETVMNISVLPANFRRKAAPHVVETEEFTTGAGHRPAKLFRRKQ